jgi:uncharacterized membrane protein YadS
LSFGRDAGSAAVIVKLTRTLLIVPIVFFYAWKKISHARSGEANVPWAGIVPWFVVWFALAALLNSLGWIPAVAQGPLQHLALFTIVVALAGVGLSTDVQKMRAAGFKPLLLGAILWIGIAVSSLALAAALKIG